MAIYPTSPLALIFHTEPAEVVAQPGFRSGTRIPIDLPKNDPYTGRSLNLLPPRFAHVQIGPGLAAVPPQAYCLAGTQHVVQPGEGDLLVIMLARRKAGMSHDAWRERWLHDHAPFGLRTAASGYRQLHPATPPDGDGFDGAGLVFFRDQDHAALSRAAPAIAEAATRDEMEFIDHSRSMLMMFALRKP